MSKSAVAIELIEMPPEGPVRTRLPEENGGVHRPLARTWMAAAAFLGVCALGECGGSWSHEAYRATGLLLLALVWLGHLGRPVGGIGWAWLGGAVASAAAAVWLSTFSVEAALLGVALWALSLAALRQAGGEREVGSPVALPLAVSGLTMALFLVLTRRIAPLWTAFNAVSDAVSNGLSTAIGRPVHMRSTYFGASVLLAAMAWVATWLADRPVPAGRRRAAGARWMPIAAVVLVVLAVQVLYVLGSAALLHGGAMVDDAAFNTQQSTAKAAVDAWESDMDNPEALAKRDAEQRKLAVMTFLHRTLPWNLPALLILGLGLLVAVLAVFADSRGEPLGAIFLKRRTVLWAGSAAAVVLIPLALWLPAPGMQDSPAVSGAMHKVVFYDRGLLNWGRPRYGDYGSRSTGMFGLLDDLLESEGIAWNRVDRIEPDTLTRADTMVFINLDEPLTPAERQRVWSFVDGGGRLLVLGDHTMQHDPAGTAEKLLGRYEQLASPPSAAQLVRRDAMEALGDLGPRAAEEVLRFQADTSADPQGKAYLDAVVQNIRTRYGEPGQWVPPLSASATTFVRRQALFLVRPVGEAREQLAHTLEQLRQIGPLAVPAIEQSLAGAEAGLRQKLQQLAAALNSRELTGLVEEARTFAELRAKLGPFAANLKNENLDVLVAYAQDMAKLEPLAAELKAAGGNRSQRRNFTNDLLGAEAGVRFNFDSADFVVGGWLHNLEYPDHPATWGMTDRRTEPGHVVGASLTTRWPARPLLIGKHGYSDTGDYGAEYRAHLGTYEFEAEEPLGDLTLAAWGPYGKGQVYAFADTSGFANPIAVSSHEFLSHIFGLLTYKRATANDGAVAVAIGLLILGVVALAAWGRHPAVLAAVALLVLAAGGAIGIDRDGEFRHPTGRNVAYVDASHVGIASDEGWRSDGLMGAHLNLERAGCYTMNLANWDSRRLADAGLLVIPPASRAYTDAEIEDVYRFVEDGGRVIATVGGEHVEPLRGLLSRFGMRVNEDGAMGYFKLPALEGGEQGPMVMFYEAWGVEPVRKADKVALIEWLEQKPLDADGNYRPDLSGLRASFPTGSPLRQPETPFELIAHYHTPPATAAEVEAQNDPRNLVRRNRYDFLILSRPVGTKGGRFVLVGDSYWAMNKNLEEEEQPDPQNVRYIDNIRFWQWLLHRLDRPGHLNLITPSPAAAPLPPPVPPPAATEPAVEPASRPASAPAATAPASDPSDTGTSP